MTVSVALPVFPVEVPVIFLTTYTEPLSLVTAMIYSLPSTRVLVSTKRSTIVTVGSITVVSSAFPSERIVNRLIAPPLPLSSSWARNFALLAVEEALLLFSMLPSIIQSSNVPSRTHISGVSSSLRTPRVGFWAVGFDGALYVAFRYLPSELIM